MIPPGACIADRSGDRPSQPYDSANDVPKHKKGYQDHKHRRKQTSESSAAKTGTSTKASRDVKDRLPKTSKSSAAKTGTSTKASRDVKDRLPKTSKSSTAETGTRTKVEGRSKGPDAKKRQRSDRPRAPEVSEGPTSETVPGASKSHRSDADPAGTKIRSVEKGVHHRVRTASKASTSKTSRGWLSFLMRPTSPTEPKKTRHSSDHHSRTRHASLDETPSRGAQDREPKDHEFGNPKKPRASRSSHPKSYVYPPKLRTRDTPSKQETTGIGSQDAPSAVDYAKQARSHTRGTRHQPGRSKTSKSESKSGRTDKDKPESRDDRDTLDAKHTKGDEPTLFYTGQSPRRKEDSSTRRSTRERATRSSQTPAPTGLFAVFRRSASTRYSSGSSARTKGKMRREPPRDGGDDR